MTGWMRRTLLLLLAFLGQSSAQAAEQFLASVVQVKDGDSLVLRAGRVTYQARLAGIDAPEYGQAWGKSARKALTRLVNRKRVTATVQDIDGYGRLVVALDLEGVRVNRQMVANGHAWAYRDYLRDPGLLELESSARQQKLGLWGTPGAVAPWLYRRGDRQPTEPESSVVYLWNRLSASLRGISSDFSCRRKTYCSQMRSCSEAQFYLRHCGLAGIDGDDDGKPCERTLCRSR